MDKLGMNVIPVDLRGAYAFGAAACTRPRPTPTARAKCLTTLNRGVADLTPGSPGDVERLVA